MQRVVLVVVFVLLCGSVTADLEDCVELFSSCEPDQPCACQHNGVCSGIEEHMACTCNTETTGYAGFYCQLPQCDQQWGLCYNGNCTAPGVCDCYQGWEGDDCATPICDPECVHGVCNGPNACNCQGTGYAGALCQDDEQECLRLHKPCDPLSECTNTIGNYTCGPCPTGFVGSPYLFYDNSPGDWNVTRGGCVAESIAATTTNTASTTTTTTTPTTTATDPTQSSSTATSSSASESETATENLGESSASGSSSIVGPVVGGVVGGVVLILIIVGIIALIIFKGKKSKGSGGDHEMKEGNREEDWSDPESD